MANIWVNNRNSGRLLEGGEEASKITADGDAAMKLKELVPWKKSYDQRTQHIKKQRHCFTKKGPSSQSYGFSSIQVWT